MIEHIFIQEDAAGSPGSEMRLNDMAKEHGWEVVSWLSDPDSSRQQYPHGRWLLRRTVETELPPYEPDPLLIEPDDSMLGWMRAPNAFERWLMRHGWLD